MCRKKQQHQSLQKSLLLCQRKHLHRNLKHLHRNLWILHQFPLNFLKIPFHRMEPCGFLSMEASTTVTRHVEICRPHGKSRLRTQSHPDMVLVPTVAKQKSPAQCYQHHAGHPGNRVDNMSFSKLYCTTQPGKNQVPGIFMPKIALYIDTSMEVVV